jgi:hypothetical protein
MIDWEHVNKLLSAIHGAATAGPKYAHIVARAEGELAEHFQNHPLPPAVDALAPVTAPPASLSATDLQGNYVEPDEDATAPTAIDRRV